MRVLVTGGSTRVMIDQVRCVGNIFKGRTATEIATHFASQRGCKVDVIGNKNMPVQQFYSHFEHYSTYDELYEAMEYQIINNRYDVIIHSAAVSDYRVKDVLNSDMESIKSGKVSSGEGEIYLKMVPTNKIVDKIREWGLNGVLVKFKLQVDMPISELISVAKNSREASNADIIVANCLEWARESAILIDRQGNESLVRREVLPKELYKMVKEKLNQ